MSCRGPTWLLLSALSSGAWGGSEVCQLFLHPASASYLAGERVHITATTPCFTSAEEGELLLRLPGSSVKAVRLTPSGAVPLGVLQVELPHLPGARAFFELRVGRAGREWTVARSPGFFILPHPYRPVSNLQRSGGEWWPVSREHPQLHGNRLGTGIENGAPNWHVPLASRAPENLGSFNEQPMLALLRLRDKASPREFATEPFRQSQISLPKRE